MAIAENRPNGNTEGTGSGGPSRSTKYSDAFTYPISNKEIGSCSEGSYYVAVTPTAGTGIILHAAPTTFDEAKAALTLYNAGTNRIYPQFLALNSTVAGVGGVSFQLTITLDTGNRRSSAGTALTVANTNMDSTLTSGAASTTFIGAVVTTAASATRRLMGNYVFRSTLIDIIGDQYKLTWGAPDAFHSTQEAATLGKIAIAAPPMCIGPGQTMCIHQWRASQSTGPTFEAVLGFIER